MPNNIELYNEMFKEYLKNNEEIEEKELLEILKGKK